MRRIGIDVGGTNTDAVLVDGGRVRRAVKSFMDANISLSPMKNLTA